MTRMDTVNNLIDELKSMLPVAENKYEHYQITYALERLESVRYTFSNLLLDTPKLPAPERSSIPSLHPTMLRIEAADVKVGDFVLDPLGCPHFKVVKVHGHRVFLVKPGAQSTTTTCSDGVPYNILMDKFELKHHGIRRTSDTIDTRP